MGKEGATVAVHYNSRSSKEGAEETVKETEKSGGKAAAFQADITKPVGITPAWLGTNSRDQKAV